MNNSLENPEFMATVNVQRLQQVRSSKRPANNLLMSTYLRSRMIHEDEKILFEGSVKIEDRQSALKGKILLKERYAVLCQSRLLLFKSEKAKVDKQHSRDEAVAVYPIHNADFMIHAAPPLTEYNFASRKSFQA